eukprot:COSAG01_NODE_61_length_29729_cov_196.711779_26_plen_703_part_00
MSPSSIATKSDISFSSNSTSFKESIYLLDHPYTKAYNLGFYCNKTTLCLIIPDVSKYIKLDDELDRIARLIGFTKLSSHNTQFIFPESFIKSHLSLHAPGKKPIILLTCTFDPETFKITNCNISLNEIETQHTFSFQSANQLLTKTTDEANTPQAKQLTQALTLAKKCLAQRQKRKALCYFNHKNTYNCHELGTLNQLDGHRNYQSTLISQEFQLLCNQLLADYCHQNQSQALYYQHKCNDNKEKKLALHNLLKQEEIKIKDQQTYNQHLKDLSQKASYTSEAKHHFAQNLSSYAFFADPIYRYASVVNQRIIKSLIKNKDPITPLYTKHDLDTYCLHFNTLQKNMFKNQVDSDIKSNQQLHQLLQQNTKCKQSFSLIIQDALLSKTIKTPPLINTLNEHIKENSILPQHLYLLLIQSKEKSFIKDIQDICLTYLEKMPGLAIQVLNIACQSHPNWSDYTLHQQKNIQNEHQMEISIVINTKQISNETPSQHRLKQTAKDLAALQFIKDYLNNKLIKFVQCSQPSEPTTVIAHEPTNKNTISEINELCQKKNWHLDCDTQVAISENKLPFYMITLSIKTATKTFQSLGKGNRKKEAKELAFTQMKTIFFKELETLEACQNPQQGKENHIGQLLHFCKAKKLGLPNYESNPKEKGFIYKVQSESHPNNIGIGESNTKKNAQHLAAKHLLDQILNITSDAHSAL